jgi:peptidyl-prolyl cis-trans isomerase A (cyclophilin A)
MRSKSWQGLWAGCVMLMTVEAPAQTNGIFADFTTSLGNFTCQLDYTNSPTAVANFVGLATGQRAWLDLPTGVARANPFYNGLTFHRVVAGFVIQGGSPNGQGSDGPGYAFPDRFSPALNFDGSWVLAMANSGPDSNGSQFFVTVAPFTSGNSNYFIFGHVVSGTNVVAAINQVATDSNYKPLTNVVMQQVAIRRVGTAAQAFDINAQGLPVVTNIPLRIAQSPGAISLTFSNRAYTDNQWYSSTNLSSWTGNSFGIEIAAPTSNSVQVATSSPQEFFRFAQVQYPSSTFAPKNILSSQLSLNLTSGGTGTIGLTLDSTNGGTFTFPPNSGAISGYRWDQEPYRGYLTLGLPLYPILGVYCRFVSFTNGTFSGSAYPAYPSSAGSFPVGGTFGFKRQ